MKPRISTRHDCGGVTGSFVVVSGGEVDFEFEFCELALFVYVFVPSSPPSNETPPNVLSVDVFC